MLCGTAGWNAARLPAGHPKPTTGPEHEVESVIGKGKEDKLEFKQNERRKEQLINNRFSGCAII